MRFEKLKLSGFKSFVEPAELRIEPGLTGIVGPNGCGKSNLLEAMRWVMGESSAKSLRGGGMEDVIFAGTASRPSRDFAEVVLSARGTLAANDDADNQLEIVRRIERGAGSAYRINGREARAKDVTLIFADAATGAHSPALVSQGRIAAVIAAKPAERRMMLEEAAGIAGLHVRRRDAEAKLRATETNLARLDDLIAGLAAQIAGLRKQAHTAERYRALSERIKLGEARAVFARWHEAAQAADRAQKEAGAAEQAVGELQVTVAACQKSQNAAAATHVATRDALSGRREAAAAHGHRRTTLATQLEAAEQRLADLDRQLARLDFDHDEAGRLTRDAVASLARLKEELAATELEVAEVEATRPALAADHEEAERAVRASELALAQAQAEQAGSDAEWRIAEAAVTAARGALSRHAAERARRDSEAAALAGNRDTEAAVESATKVLDDARTALKDAQTRREALAGKRSELVAARDAAGDALARARAEFAGIERELEALRRERAARAKRGGGPRAIDSLRAAPGFERALAAMLRDEGSAALGQPEASATGRFWAGAVAPEQRPDSIADHVPIAPPELAARLALVRFAEEDDGRSLSPGEWLVTRGGALRRWDGFVVRGEGASEAASLEAANRLAALEAAAPSLRAARDKAAQRAEATAAALAGTQAELAAAEQALSAAAAAERNALRALDQAEAARERHAARTAEVASALAELEKRDAQLTAELAAAEAKRDALPDPALGRESLAQARSSHDATRDGLQQAAAALARCDQALAAKRERRALLRADIRSWEARSGDAEKRIAEVVRRRDELAGERAVLAARPEGLRRDIAEAEDIGRTLAAELAAVEEEAAQAEAASKEADRQLAAAGEALAGARETRAAAVARAESQEARRAEATRLAGERFACPAPVLPTRFEFAAADVGEAAAEQSAMDRLVAERERLGPVNLVAADELAAAEEKHGETATEQAELTEAVNRLRGSIGSLNREGRERLRAAFQAVDAQFQRLFGQLFNGGSAHLAMIDSDDPLEAGLEIFAQPPGKRLQSLTLLSGGEQALTAVALIFALFLTKPAPICVLDEVDAPLDDANVERFCDLLDFMVAETATRYLIVTHNAVTMSRMHRLFGVTMVEQGVSRLVSVDLLAAEELLAAE